MSEAGTRYSVETGRSGLTYEDYCALPDDGLRYEIVDGMLFAEPAPRRAHQKAVGNLFAILHAWVRAHDLGEVYVAPFDVILDPRTTVEPDLVFVVKDRLAIVAERGVEAAPDLLVEVLSPGTARRQHLHEERSEEHTSELQSRSDLVCRLLLEKKKTNTHRTLDHVRHRDTHV